MTIEEKLKEYILSHYKSVRQFCIQNNFAYSTIDGIFKRGLGGSSVSVVLKMCTALGISVDELGNDCIVEIKNDVTNSQSLTRRQKRIVELFNGLTEEQQDNIIGRAEMLSELNEQEYKQDGQKLG